MKKRLPIFRKVGTAPMRRHKGFRFQKKKNTKSTSKFDNNDNYKEFGIPKRSESLSYRQTFS